MSIDIQNLSEEELRELMDKISARLETGDESEADSKGRLSDLDHVIALIGKFGDNAAQARLGKVQGMLYAIKREGWNEAKVRAAARTLKGVGIDLMKYASRLTRGALK